MGSQLSECIYRVASALPPLALEALARSLAGQSLLCQEIAGDRILKQFPNPKFRRLVGELLSAWQQDTENWDSLSLAMALKSSAYALAANRQALDVELVWTGPESPSLPVRRTHQVLLQLIRETQQQLTLVSFAVYKIPEIASAMLAALNRGAILRIIAETPDSGGGKIPFGVATSLGKEILQRSQVFVWPLEKRPKDAAGRSGSLHVKAVISDGKRLFLTSANLTEYALTLNLELGVLVHSPTLAGQVTDLLDDLIQQGILVRPVID